MQEMHPDIISSIYTSFYELQQCAPALRVLYQVYTDLPTVCSVEHSQQISYNSYVTYNYKLANS